MLLGSWPNPIFFLDKHFKTMLNKYFLNVVVIVLVFTQATNSLCMIQFSCLARDSTLLHRTVINDENNIQL